MAQDPVKQRDELLNVLSQAEQQAARIESLGQDLIRSARLSRDVIAPMRDVLLVFPVANVSSERLDREVTSWRSWCENCR